MGDSAATRRPRRPRSPGKGGGESAPEGSLEIDPSRLSGLLLDGSGSPRRRLEALLSLWIARGVIRSGGIHIRRRCRWQLLAHAPVNDGCAMERDSSGAALQPGHRGCPRAEAVTEHARALPRLLSLPPAPSSHGGHRPINGGRSTWPFLCYSLGHQDEEIARIILESETLTANTPLPEQLHTAVTLFLAAVRGGGEGGRASSPPGIGHSQVRDQATGPGQDPSSEDGDDPLLAQKFPEMIGSSPKLRAMQGLIERAAPTHASILIVGESGTGKELVGRAIHRLSKRSAAPFVSENCAAFSESLLEAEIFGSEKGAYTGADQTRQGLIERAQGGTLFLDEIGEMGAALQSKLLRVLQEREVRRVGGSKVHAVDFRLITATHRDLEEEVRHGRFRRDLLFRIEVIRIKVPPLRERREDIPLLVEHYLDLFVRQRGIDAPPIDGEAMEILRAHDWPGNIRELRNEIERALTLTPGHLTSESLSSRLVRPLIHHPVARRVREELGADLEGLERIVIGGVIADVLAETGGNKTEAARILGIPKTNLYRRLERYGIRK